MTPTLPPSTTHEELAWILQYEETAGPFADFIVAARYKAVYGEWPDGKQPPLPSTKGLDANSIKWLMSQSLPTKWLKGRLKPSQSKELPFVVKPVRPIQPVEAFPGQREWLRKQKLREQDAAKRAKRRQQDAEHSCLLLERQNLLVWFREHLGIACDGEWQEKFLRLRAIEESLLGSGLQNQRRTKQSQRLKRCLRKCAKPVETVHA